MDTYPTSAEISLLELQCSLTLVISSRQELRYQIICASDERLALKLADHIPSQLLTQLLQALFNNGPPLRAFRIVQWIFLPQQSFFLLNSYPLLRQFPNPLL